MNVGLISAVYKVIQLYSTCMFFFYILFHYGLSQDIKYSALKGVVESLFK